MRQFDVLDNPIPGARRAMPFVAILQSDLAPRAAIPTIAGRLIPIVEVENQDFALLVPSLTALPVADLRQVIASLAADRERILAALDYLFIGF